ncbi:MAG: DNA phosphorothioation-dependent restriction protein DptF [Ruminococcus sp.]|nr:DNA phosphorothioation-dependent restriction protein DptF [Ruminococcus sp.]
MLIEELKRLKKSSQDAVDNENSFNDFKKYMHIHRQVEDDLIAAIQCARESNGKSLILVCGNVGDGKSHLISYLNHHKNNYLDGFIIHNDATESLSRSRNEREELARVLSDFSDSNIDNTADTKIIVAINLGVLSNFLSSDEGKNFTRLADYVEKNKILVDTEMSFSDNKADEIFFNVNFGDYHIYRLNEGEADSPYISEFIDKIFSDNAGNTFYDAYRGCHICDMCDCCPVKSNYEMMSIPTVKAGITSIILEAVIKDKIILSTRELLDFFYDIIVHPEYNKTKYKNYYKKNKLKAFMEYSLPSIMYKHGEVSTLLAHIKKYDFISVRSELFDNIITKFNITDEPAGIFEQYIENNSCLKFMLSNATEIRKSDKEEFLQLLARMCKAASKSGEIETIDKEFNEFVSYIYYARKGDVAYLKKLYTTVMKCVSFWNGGNGENLNLNTSHEDYVISTSLDYLPDASSFACIDGETVFERFPAYINLTFMSKKDNSQKASVSIDYDLYSMLKKVESGYRPSVKDSNSFAGFVSFIKKLSDFGNQNEEIAICHYVGNSIKEYALKKDVFNTYEFKEVK